MPKRKVGFAAMDPEEQRKIAAKGGISSHKKGVGHEFTPEEARAAGSKGGKIAHERGTAHEFSQEEARTAGSLGGKKVAENRQHMRDIGMKGIESRRRARVVSDEFEKAGKEFHEKGALNEEG